MIFLKMANILKNLEKLFKNPKTTNLVKLNIPMEIFTKDKSKIIKDMDQAL